MNAQLQRSGETRFASFSYDDGGDASVADMALDNIIKARSLGLPSAELAQAHDYKMVVVARAPSVLGYIDQIIRAQNEGAAVFAVNDAHDWLIENGCIPNGFIVFEVNAYEPLKGLKKNPEVTYFIASHCHPENFRMLEGCERVVWHSNNDWPGTEEEISKFGEGSFIVGGGSTTMMRNLSLGMVLGFRKFDLYGVDSSYTDKSHGIGKSSTDTEITVIASGCDGFKAFRTLPYLARQADEFRRWCEAFPQADVRVFGDGLLPYIHRSMHPEKYQQE